MLAILRREKLSTARAWTLKEAATELWRYLRRGCTANDVVDTAVIAAVRS